MRFNIFDPETGRFTQSNKVYSPEGYDKVLLERGIPFISDNEKHPLNLDAHFHHKGEAKKREPMPVTASKTEVKAGSGDTAVFRNIPPGARMKVETGGMVVHDGIVPAEVEIAIPVPCVYRVTITKWPMLDFVVEVRALA